MSEFTLNETLEMQRRLQEKYNDILLCFDISPEELRQIYIEKIKKNMTRW